MAYTRRPSALSFSAYSSALKMGATCSSETSVDFQQTTRRCIPEDSSPIWLCHLFSNRNNLN
jgi:hypothetical protein